MLEIRNKQLFNLEYCSSSLGGEVLEMAPIAVQITKSSKHTKGSKDTKSRTKSKECGEQLLEIMASLFGVDLVLEMLDASNDLSKWKGLEHRVVNVLTDMAGWELVAFQIMSTLLPMTCQPDVCHRGSNSSNSKYIGLEKVVRGIRAFMRAPFGSRGNLGELQNARERLLARASSPDLPQIDSKWLNAAIREYESQDGKGGLIGMLSQRTSVFD